MKQFCYASAVGTSAGQISVNGNNLVLHRNAENGGDILYPIFDKEFTANVSEGYGAVQMSKEFTIPEVSPYMDYTVIFVKTGTGFNERSNWTATIHTGAKDDSSTVAAAIAKYATDNKELLGLTVVADGAKVTVTGPVTGENYEIKFADELYGTTFAEGATNGKEAYLNAKGIMDLANKCAADAGFEYTYDDFAGLYPNFPFDPLALGRGEDKQFCVVNIRFTEPRQMGTREESVYQLIHVAVPTKAVAKELTTALATFAKKGTVTPPTE